MVSKHLQKKVDFALFWNFEPPYSPTTGGPNGANHISMYFGYHNIEIKTRYILKLNFGIRANDWFLAELCVKGAFIKEKLPY